MPLKLIVIVAIAQKSSTKTLAICHSNNGRCVCNEFEKEKRVQNERTAFYKNLKNVGKLID